LIENDYLNSTVSSRNPNITSKNIEKKNHQITSGIINLLIIPHSNCFVERVFSLVNLTKTRCRNLLEVSTVSTQLQVKTYHDDNEMKNEKEKYEFETDEDHYLCYSQTIKTLN